MTYSRRGDVRSSRTHLTQSSLLAAVRGLVWRPADLRAGIVAHVIRGLAW